MMVIAITERGEKMLVNNGYLLIYYKNRNQIVISLPQTSKTLTNTLEPVVDRRVDVEEKELAILLNVTQYIFLNGTKMDEVTDGIKQI